MIFISGKATTAKNMCDRARGAASLLAGAIAMVLCLSISSHAGVGESGWMIFKKAQAGQFSGIASVALTHGDFSGVLYNPALLGARSSKELYFVSESGLSEDSLNGVLYGQPLDTGMVSAGFVYYDAGKLDLNWIENGVLKTQSVSAQKDMMGIFSYGRRISHKAYAGASVKVAQSSIAERNSALAYALDLGLVYVPSPNMPLSVVVQNLGTSTKFIDKENPLPTTLYMGGGYYHEMRRSYLLSGVGVSANMVDRTMSPEAGVELGYDFLSVNAGYRFGALESVWHLGMGVKLRNIDFGYAFVPSTYLNSSHKFNVSMKFGASSKRTVTAPKRLAPAIKPVPAAALKKVNKAVKK